MTHLIKYRQFYPDREGFQFWRDRMVCLEIFGMRWCVVIYSPIDEKHAHAIVYQAIMHAIENINYASTREAEFNSLLNYTLTLINEELVKFKFQRKIDLSKGIGIAVTVVDSEGRMAYAQGGDAVVMLFQNGMRHARGRQDITDYRDYNGVELMRARRSFGTYKRWIGFVSDEFRLMPGDVWFISTEANFRLMHDGLPDEMLDTLNSSVVEYWNAIKDIYNNSGLLYAGILVSGEYLAEATCDVIGMDSIRIWNKWRELDEQLREDLPPGVGLYGRTPPFPISDEVSADQPSEVSERPINADTPIINSNGELPWWRKYSWKKILLIAFILQWIIRLVLSAITG